ncbi:MAG TPA: hypothetical protein VIE47_01570 [Methylocystis sp.]|jgi:hypothetical protein
MIRRTAKILCMAFALAFASLAQAREGGPAFAPFGRDREEAPALPPEGRAQEGAPPGLECFSVAQTRQKIAQHRLAEPFPLMRAESNANQADALSTRLCRLGELFLYEINLLRRDGRVIRVFIDAASGKPSPYHPER